MTAEGGRLSSRVAPEHAIIGCVVDSGVKRSRGLRETARLVYARLQEWFTLDCETGLR